MDIPAWLLVHEVTVRPFLGEGSNGPIVGDPVPLQCMAQGGVRLIRNTEGNTTTASLTLYAAPGAQVPTGSTVEWNGGTWTVLQVLPHDDGGLGAPQHVEVICQ